MREPTQKFQKLEQWGRLCVCGDIMKAYPFQASTPLVDKETWQQIVAGVGYDHTKISLQTMDRFDSFEFYALNYRCPACGRRTADWDAQFTAEEAEEVAANQNQVGQNG